MTPVEQPLRCLAVRVVLDEAGEIDGLELEAYLDDVAGHNLWLTTTEWLFVDPPSESGEDVTVPVVVPEGVATKAILADLTSEPNRIVTDHQVTPAEARKWRWVAFQVAPNPQGQGVFPWEAADA